MPDDPRLELADVERMVATLPIQPLAELAQGPILGRGCRVCRVLRSIDTDEAKALLGWHEFFEETPGLDKVTENWRDRETEDDRHLHRTAFGEWKRVAGMLSYARCCTIYLAARLCLERTTRP